MICFITIKVTEFNTVEALPSTRYMTGRTINVQFYVHKPLLVL